MGFICNKKTCIKCLVVVWLRLFFKVIFIWKCIKIIYFYFLKIIFNISASKWSKTLKNINLEQRKKLKLLNFFQKRFWNAKTNSVLRNSVKKACKNCFTKTAFQTQFFSGPHSIKRNFYSYQTSCCVFCTANTNTHLISNQILLLFFLWIDTVTSSIY